MMTVAANMEKIHQPPAVPARRPLVRRLLRAVTWPLWWPIHAVFGRVEQHFLHEAASPELPRLSATSLEDAAFAPPGKAVAAMIMLLTLLLVTLLAWSAFFEIDIFASGSGKIIPASTVQQLSTLEGGVVTEILVKEGQRVKRDDPLLRLSPVVAQGAVTERQASREGLLASIARLEAEAENRAPVYPEEIKGIAGLVEDEERVRASRAATLSSAIEVFRQQRAARAAEASDHVQRLPQYQDNLRLLTEQVNQVEPLVKRGSVAPVELMGLQREQGSLRAQIIAARQGAAQAQAQMGEFDRRIQEKVAAFRGEAREEMTRKQTQLKSLQGELSGREELLQRTVIKSPVDGLVKTLHITTIGGIASPGKNIVDIVPANDTLLIEARIGAQDIAYIKPGMPSKVRITAFDSGALGSMDGVVDFISPDSQIDERTGALYYRIQVRTPYSSVNTAAGSLNLLPGMVAEVDVVTGRRTVMAYIFRPLARGMARSLSER